MIFSNRAINYQIKIQDDAAATHDYIRNDAFINYLVRYEEVRMMPDAKKYDSDHSEIVSMLNCVLSRSCIIYVVIFGSMQDLLVLRFGLSKVHDYASGVNFYECPIS